MADYYVATAGGGGSDGGLGTLASPWLTYAHAITQISGPGNTLNLRGGTYTTAITAALSGTSWSNTFRVANYNSEPVWIIPSSGGFGVVLTANEHYVEFDGININASALPNAIVKLETSSGNNPHHIRMQNAELIGNPSAHPIHGFGVIVIVPLAGQQGANEWINLTVHGGGSDDFNHGFYLEATEDLVERCNIYDWAGAGIQVVNNFGHPPENVILRYNRIHDLRQTFTGAQRHWGVIVGSAAVGTQIYFNAIWNIPDQGSSSAGIDIFTGVDTRIHHNSIYNAGIGIHIESGSSGTLSQNNIAYACGVSYQVDPPATASQDHNLFASNPDFVDAPNGDLSLNAGSPALDTAVTVAGFTVDLTGAALIEPRDIGAYQFGSGGGDPTIAIAAGLIIAHDTFTGFSGSNLVGVDGELGAAWTEHLSAGGNIVRTAGNTARLGEAATITLDYASAIASTNEYDVWGVYKVVSLAGDEYQLWGRIDPTTYTGYLVYYAIAGATWHLVVYLNGAFSSLDSYAQALSVGSSYGVRLKLRATSVSVDIDDTQVMYSANTSVMGIGRGGLGGYTSTAPGNGVGIQYDRFLMTQVEPGGSNPTLSWLPGTIVVQGRRGAAVASGFIPRGGGA